MASSNVVATYSIVACDLDAGQWGVGVQSKFLAVGSVVPCHYGTFPLLKGTPDELKQQAAGVEVHELEPGQSLSL